MVFVTFSLSPVRIFVLTPCSFNAFIAPAADSFGGSKNARYPISIISHSSSTLQLCFSTSFLAMASTRNPFTLRSSTVSRIFFLKSFVIGSTFPLYSAYEHMASISSTAPFVTIFIVPARFCTTVVSLRLLKSNGISSIFL